MSVSAAKKMKIPNIRKLYYSRKLVQKIKCNNIAMLGGRVEMPSNKGNPYEKCRNIDSEPRLKEKKKLTNICIFKTGCRAVLEIGY